MAPYSVILIVIKKKPPEPPQPPAPEQNAPAPAEGGAPPTESGTPASPIRQGASYPIGRGAAVDNALSVSQDSAPQAQSQVIEQPTKAEEKQP